jgi:hypothetical protein
MTPQLWFAAVSVSGFIGAGIALYVMDRWP